MMVGNYTGMQGHGQVRKATFIRVPDGDVATRKPKLNHARICKADESGNRDD